MIRAILVAALSFSLVGIGACKTPPVAAPQDTPPASPETSKKALVQEIVTPESKPSTPSPTILRERDDLTKWLFVETVRDGAPGAWATGDFDAQRNKLIIKTKDVDQFAIDTSRVRINWKRLVILGIDGRNTELRKRDFAVYHFKRDKHARWVVIE